MSTGPGSARRLQPLTGPEADGRPEADASAESESSQPWPPGVSRRPTMSIGGVLSLLKAEFPAMTLSKLRFLEEQDIVAPERTAAGYRTYSQADVERLRFALASQRDSFLPWRVIRERLAELDRGGQAAPTKRVVADDSLGDPAPGAGARVQATELVDLTGVSAQRLDELVQCGLISADAAGRFPAGTVELVQIAEELAEHGIDTRHLRLMRAAADRQVDVIGQITAPVRGRGSGAARERAAALAVELSQSLGRLHTALVRAGVDRLA